MQIQLQNSNIRRADQYWFKVTTEYKSYCLKSKIINKGVLLKVNFSPVLKFQLSCAKLTFQSKSFLTNKESFFHGMNTNLDWNFHPCFINCAEKFSCPGCRVGAHVISAQAKKQTWTCILLVFSMKCKQIFNSRFLCWI